jgi:ABC-type siderophore export system fused ATPase/permease subunit
MDLLDELNRSGFTIVVITHDEKVAAHAGRMIAISDGVLTELAGSEQVGADRG